MNSFRLLDVLAFATPLVLILAVWVLCGRKGPEECDLQHDKHTRATADAAQRPLPPIASTPPSGFPWRFRHLRRMRP